MAKITIPDILAAFASNTSINARFQQIEDALNNYVLYRDLSVVGVAEPNTMNQDLDMNTNSIINLVDPVNAQDAATKTWVETNGAIPDATTTSKGKVELATTAEVDAGAAGAAIVVTPGGLVNILANIAVNSTKPLSTRSIATTAPLTGGGDLSADRTLAISAATSSAAGSMSGADKTKADFTTVTQAVNLDTMESTISSNVTAIALNTAKTSNVTHSGDATGDTVLTISNNAVSNAKAADMVGQRIKGRATAGTGDPEDMTGTQVLNIIGVEAGATADQTNSEIKIAYEANSNTEVFTTANQTTVNSVENNADVTDATNVAAAGAVMDSDISAGEGILRKTGVGVYVGIKTNLTSLTNPGSGDNFAAGYSINSPWINTTGGSEKAWTCVGDGIWVEGGSVGGAVTSVTGSAPIVETGTSSVPNITITAATGAAAGSMSAVDKTFINAINSTAVELNYNYNITLGTGIASKVVTLDSSSNFTSPGAGTWLFSAGSTVNFAGTLEKAGRPIGDDVVASVYVSANYSHSSEEIRFNSENLDSHSFFNTTTYRFLPTIAGWYEVIVSTASSTSVSPTIRKNNSDYAYGLNSTANRGICSSIVQCNGTTDYISAYMVGSTTITGTYAQTRMDIKLLRAT